MILEVKGELREEIQGIKSQESRNKIRDIKANKLGSSS